MARSSSPASELGYGLIDVPTRLRRAIILDDIYLVKRIVRTHPQWLRNPDFDDKSNTSLHLAARYGHYEIAEFLIGAGHEDEGISRNADWDTPLMLAAEAKQTDTERPDYGRLVPGKIDVGKLLLRDFGRCVPWANKGGMDALMIASWSGALPLLQLLLTATPPALPTAHDNDGNTALHHASAAGELKALRLLLHFGANPVAQNNYSWTPINYSSTAAAEAYFIQLVAEFEKRRVEGLRQQEKETASRQQQQMRGGVRLVTQDDSGGPIANTVHYRPREDSLSNLTNPPNIEWSPVERRAMTPTDGGTPVGWAYGRTRASSGE